MKVDGYSAPHCLLRYGDDSSNRIRSTYEDDILFIQVVDVIEEIEYINNSDNENSIMRVEKKCETNNNNDSLTEILEIPIEEI